MAYEKLDKLRLSKSDYGLVKELNPGNKQASEGLHRISKLLRDEEPGTQNKSEIEELKRRENQNSRGNEFATLEDEKNSANALFKAGTFQHMWSSNNKLFVGKLQDARDQFQTLVTKIEKSIKENEKDKEYTEKLHALCLQVLSNRALSSYNLKDIDESLSDCNKAIKIDPQHQKCLYRRALCNIAKAEKAEKSTDETNEDSLNTHVGLLEAGRQDLETVHKLDNKNAEVKNKLSDVVRIIVQHKLKLRDIKDKKTASTEQQTGGAKQDIPQNKNSQGLSKEKLKNITSNVVSSVTSKYLFFI